MNIYMKALGCRLNEAELECWAGDFLADGHQLAESAKEADLVIVNTCAVTNEAVKKSRQLIRKAHRQNPYAKLVVSGCYASLSPEIREEIPAIDLLIPNRDKDRLHTIVRERLLPDTMPAAAINPGATSLFQRGRNRAFIKIQDGCRYRCTFCIVTVARGSERSRESGEIINQINQLYEKGIKEVVLTGVHVGGYGSDIGLDLYALINQILTDTDIPRLRLASVEPWDLPANFFDLFDNDRLMPHMHLPLQSGSDAVLKLMARRCKTGDFSGLIDTAKQAVPGFNVTTDVIVGFPGESDSEWQKSIEYIESIGFSHIHIFPYSARAGTRAATMPDQVAPAVRKQRCEELQRLATRLKKQSLLAQVGKTMPVLIENQQQAAPGLRSEASGYTPNYYRTQLEVAVDGPLQNLIKTVKILSLNENCDTLVAELS